MSVLRLLNFFLAVDVSCERTTKEALDESFQRIIFGATIDESEVAEAADMVPDVAVNEQPAGLSEIFMGENNVSHHQVLQRTVEALRKMRGSNPVNEFEEMEYIMCASFPCIFPYGRIFSDKEPFRWSLEIKRAMVLHHSGKVEQDAALMFLYLIAQIGTKWHGT